MKKDIDFFEEIGNFVFTSKYARYDERHHRRETWDEAVKRVEKMHYKKYKGLSSADLEEIAWAFDQVREKHVVPSMRSMQFGGKPIEAQNARLYNCSMTHISSIRSFSEIFFLLLCGTGVGTGLNKKLLNRLPDLVGKSDRTGTVVTYVVEDSIEGWADSVEALLSCYFKNNAFTGRKISFDFSKIRPKGAPIKTGGGKAPGHEGLKQSLKKIKDRLDYIIEKRGQNRLLSIDAYDIIMHVADAVLSGGVRRSATIFLFPQDDDLMLNAKTNFKILRKIGFESHTNKKGETVWEGRIVVDPTYGGIEGHKYEVTLTDYEYNEMLCKDKVINWRHIEPQRARSNNSVLLMRDKVTLDFFTEVVNKIKQYGEPGFVFADDERFLVNPCFHRDTRIHTANGMIRIEDLAKNGKTFRTSIDSRIGKGDLVDENNYGVSLEETSTPAVITQNNAPIYKLTTEHGYTINVTENHSFPTPDGRKELKELNKGDVIYLSSGEGSFGNEGNYNKGLIMGLVAGDGTFYENGARLSVWEDDFNSLDSISRSLEEEFGRKFEWRDGTVLPGGKKLKSINSVLVFKMLEDLVKGDPRSIKNVVPECVWRGTKDMVIGYLHGMIFSDGSVSIQKNSQKSGDTLTLEIAQSNKVLLQQIQILLQNLGIVSRIYRIKNAGFRSMPDGKGGKKDYFCRDVYKIVMNRPNMIEFISRYGLFGRKDEKARNLIIERGSSCRKRERFISKVKSIEYLCNDDVYCFTQPKTNSTVANGMAVGQCSEIGAIPVTEDGECGVQFCNLVSMNGRHIDSLEKFKMYAKAATIIGTLQAGYTNFKYLNNTSRKLTEAEALLGVSVTGFMDNPDILLNPEIQAEVAKYTKEVNAEWAKKIGIKPAARITCAKPEGSTSLMLGTASGIHPHHSRRYFRRIQCNKEDNVYKHFKSYNSHATEPSIWSSTNSDDMATFPLTVSDKAMIKEDLTALKHLEIILSTQKNWVLNGETEANTKNIHHNISCTVIVDDKEWEDVIKYIYENRNYFTGISFISKMGDKIYKQAPNESIVTKEDEEEFERIKSGWKHVDYGKLNEHEDVTELRQEVACAGGSCEIVSVG